MGNEIKIRIDGSAAYVSAEPDADGWHHGVMKHIDDPVSVRWDEELQKWVRREGEV